MKEEKENEKHKTKQNTHQKNRSETQKGVQHT